MELDDTILQSKTTIELVGFIKRLWKQMLLHDELSHVTVTTAESAKLEKDYKEIVQRSNKAEKKRTKVRSIYADAK